MRTTPISSTLCTRLPALTTRTTAGEVAGGESLVHLRARCFLETALTTTFASDAPRQVKVVVCDSALNLTRTASRPTQVAGVRLLLGAGVKPRLWSSARTELHHRHTSEKLTLQKTASSIGPASAWLL